MRNHTTVTVFILLGLTDDPQLQILLFIFLFITYILSITGNLTIITLTLVDPHLKTPMYFFLQNFSFLEILFTTTCIPRFLYNLSTGDRVITYKACFIQLFLTDLFGGNWIFSLGNHVLWSLRGHLQTLTLYDDHEQQTVQNNGHLLLDGSTYDYPPTTQLRFSSGILWFKHHWSFCLWCVTSPEDLMLRHMVNWADGYSLLRTDPHHHSSLCSSLLHLHYKDNSKIPFSSTKKKSFFYMFFPHNCTFHLLWQLNLHLYQTICKRRGKY